MTSAATPKPRGWWTTHPALLNVAVHGAYDANGDGLGDFEGIRRKLDFFLDMGISGYRLQHVGKYGDDPAWAGLVQQDWFDVDPHYGTMADFDRLMQECARKDVKIIMMAVPEYLGWHHPDYLAARQAREQGTDDPRTRWFDWHDDGTVVTCWDRPAPDCSNPAYFDAFLKHVGFWMDKGIAGWDADAVPTWHHLTEEHLRKFTDFVKSRDGFVTAENMVLEFPMLRSGGFNAGTGYLRHEYYNELKAILEQKPDYVRDALRRRETLIAHGMFPYQQFGDDTYAKLYQSGNWSSNKREMFRLQVAFNAVLPDQVWIAGCALTCTPRLPASSHLGVEGAIDWTAIERQQHDPASPFSHVKRMFALRAQHKELGIGHIQEVPTDHPQEVFAAIRTSEDGEEQALVAFNFSENPVDLSIHLHAKNLSRLQNYLSGEVVTAESGRIGMRLFPYGYKLLKVLR